MKYLRRALREHLGSIWREIRVTLTPIPHPQKWVFLVGCYNSGTTLLAELLGAHPSISALPTEGHFITDQFIKDYAIGLPRMWAKREELFRLTENDQGPDPDRIKKEWGMRLDTSKPLLLEKSPPNTPRTLWLQKHFENSYFIAIVRNGYAVAEGISRKGDPKHIATGWPVEDCALQWRRSNEVLLEDQAKLKHLLWLRYEDLTENTSETLRKITDFLGIQPFSDMNEQRSWQIHERNEPVKNLNQQSIGKLSKEQIASINQVCGPMLEQFGYELL